MTVMDGERYLVSMASEDANRVRMAAGYPVFRVEAARQLQEIIQ